MVEAAEQDTGTEKPTVTDDEVSKSQVKINNLMPDLLFERSYFMYKQIILLGFLVIFGNGYLAVGKASDGEIIFEKIRK